MSPAALLILAVSLTFAAAMGERICTRRHRKALQALATQWRMNYSPHDQFRITPRVFISFPVAGAAKIRVVDLIYGMDHDVYRYIFTAEYTAGVVMGKRRIRRAASLSEPRERAPEALPAPIVLAPSNLSLMDQYRRLSPPTDSVLT